MVHPTTSMLQSSSVNSICDPIAFHHSLLLSLRLIQNPKESFSPSKLARVSTITSRREIAVFVIETAILIRPTKQCGILIPFDAFVPGPTNDRRVDQDIHFLRMEPALRILVSRSLDSHAIVYDEQLDMTAPLLKGVMDRVILVGGHVEEDLQKGLFELGQLRVKVVGCHLVRAALSREQLAGVVVT